MSAAGPNDKGEKVLRVFEEFPGGIGIFDTDVNLIYANTAMEEIMRSGEKVICNEIVSAARGKGFSSGIIHIGEKSYAFTLHFSPSFRYLILFLKDITDRVYFHRVIQDRKTEETVNYVFSFLRHEIGNFLNAMRFSLDMLKEEVQDKGEGGIESKIGMLSAGIEAIERVLHSMRRYTRIGELALRKIDLREILSKIFSLLNSKFEKLGIEVQLEVGGDLYVKADETALTQALVNILRNSVEALKEVKGKRVIEIKAMRRKEYAEILIYDTGPGIPKSLQGKIFLPFITTKGKGRGLGLALSKELISAMKGGIEIEETEMGAIVKVYLPLWEEVREDSNLNY